MMAEWDRSSSERPRMAAGLAKRGEALLPASQCDEMPCQRIRVLVVDGHAAVRHALATFVISQQDMELAGETASLAEAIQMCAGRQPDVILMDVGMTDLNSAAATRAIRQGWPPIQIIAMSSFQEEGQIPEMLKAGAVGCLLKNVSADDLARAIREAHDA
jgi:two-component system, NarL family, response regulator LiaR